MTNCKDSRPLWCGVFIAVSLDGYIARADGAIDWLEAANQTVPAGEDCGYAAFMAGVDLLVMGRRTWEQVASFEPWPYAGTPVWVASRSLRSLGAGAPEGVRLTADAPQDIVAQAGRQGLQRLYVDGGELIRAFMREGLITDLTLTTLPVLLGSGRSLWDGLGTGVRLELQDSRAYPFGFVQSRYKVLGAA